MHCCRPPRNDAKGIAIACGLIAAWVVLFYHGCWQIKLTNAPDGSSRRSSWFDIVATFLLLEFVNTGLFITTHDAMHGTICFRCGCGAQWFLRHTTVQVVAPGFRVRCFVPCACIIQVGLHHPGWPEMILPVCVCAASSPSRAGRRRRNRKLNDALGRIAITLYAYFDYSMLHEKHW